MTVTEPKTILTTMKAKYPSVLIISIQFSTAIFLDLSFSTNCSQLSRNI